MNKIKSLYEAPTTETLVVRFEGRILDIASPGKAGSDDDIIKDPTDF